MGEGRGRRTGSCQRLRLDWGRAIKGLGSISPSAGQ